MFHIVKSESEFILLIVFAAIKLLLGRWQAPLHIFKANNIEAMAWLLRESAATINEMALGNEYYELLLVVVEINANTGSSGVAAFSSTSSGCNNATEHSIAA